MTFSMMDAIMNEKSTPMTNHASLAREHGCNKTELLEKCDFENHGHNHRVETPKHDPWTKEFPGCLPTNPAPSLPPGTTETNLQFWTAELADVPRPPRSRFAGAAAGEECKPMSACHTVAMTLEKELSIGISDLSVEFGVTSNAFLLGAFSIVLSRTLDMENAFCIVTTVYEKPEVPSFLPLKITPHAAECAKDVIEKVFAKQTLLAKHADIDPTTLLIMVFVKT